MANRYYQGLSEFHCYATRVTTGSMRLWVGTLERDMHKPAKARVRVCDVSGRQVRVRPIRHADWERPFPAASQDRFYKSFTFKGLRPGRMYRAYFERWRADVKTWEILRSASIRTLPVRLPLHKPRAKPFTIALGSCYWPDQDGGRVGTAYRGLYDHPKDPHDSPDLTFLTGDQVYLDVGFDLRSWVPREVRRRIAQDYARHWQGLSDVLTRGATYMLPDDHEWYNGYPDPDPNNPYLWALQDKKVRKAWERTARQGIENVQQCPVVEIMEFPGDLSLCFADLRSFRKPNLGGLMNPKDLNRVLAWAQGLTTPGVLVSPQPLIVTRNPHEANLLDYTGDYCQLLAALGSTGHDIVVMSGDVHYGRVVSVKLGTEGATLHEVISSPLSNLTGFPAWFAGSLNRWTPKRFPSKRAFAHREGKQALSGWQRQKVNHYRDNSKGGSKYDIEPNPWAYPRRTREHFMTIAFSRYGNGSGIRMTVKGWLVRDVDPRRKRILPQQAFRFSRKLKFSKRLE
ncbi:MAG: hypothetical protein F4Z24_01880 [Nitrospira sp. SB0666_bin_27]|nr:hypothetical protein [Nitrospira sp. SB0666_bin_27]MYF24407.1 hypothetical protein [Nitrospira sp. SB0678_bin_10]